MSDPAGIVRGILPATCRLLAAFVAGWTLLIGGTAVAQTASAVQGSAENTVVATIDGQSVPASALDSFIAPQLMSLRQKRQAILEKGLNAYLSQQVLQREAQARDLTVNALLGKEVTSKAPKISAADVDAFYTQNKDRISQPKAKVAPSIKQYLLKQAEQKLFDNYVAGLKAKYHVKVLLEPLRIDVDTPTTPSRGPADAPVTIVEFGDFQCPFCGQLEKTLAKIKQHYGDKIRLAFRQFPLQRIHPYAYGAAEASLCAREQGKFWALHDRMYANQNELTIKDLKTAATKLGMNTTQFDACLDSGKYDDTIRADVLAGQKAGVTGTPALFVNGRPVPGGAVGYDVLAKVINEELAAARQD